MYGVPIDTVCANGVTAKGQTVSGTQCLHKRSFYTLANNDTIYAIAATDSRFVNLLIHPCMTNGLAVPIKRSASFNRPFLVI